MTNIRPVKLHVVDAAPLLLSTVSVKETAGQRIAAALAARCMSQGDLERAAGLSKGHASRLMKGAGKKIVVETIAILAEALGVDYQWLALGVGSMGPDTRTAQPAAPRQPSARAAVHERVETIEAPRVYDDGIEWLLYHATDRSCHEPEDQTAVRAFAAKRGPLLRKDQDMVRLVQVWLDVAAELRTRGEVPTFTAMIDALTTRKGRPEFRDEDGRTEADIAGDIEYEQQTGRKPPGHMGKNLPLEQRSPVPPSAKTLTPKPPSSKGSGRP